DERASLRLWYDRLSGDDDPTDATIGAFHTLYATNHKFYGYADLFVDVPAHTGGRGLQDIALRTTYRPADRLDVGLDTHLFRLEAPTDEVPARLAEELDLTARYRYDANFTVTAGVSYVVGGPALARLGRPDGNQAFGYLMLDATF
ncbi:MAG: alginate export family protein, partial [Gemmatimonadota bacterium]